MPEKTYILKLRVKDDGDPENVPTNEITELILNADLDTAGIEITDVLEIKEEA